MQGTAALPSPGEKFNFKNLCTRLGSPFIAYADMETVLQPMKENAGGGGRQRDIQMHALCAYDIVIVETSTNRIVYYELMVSSSGENLTTNLIDNTTAIYAEVAQQRSLYNAE